MINYKFLSLFFLSCSFSGIRTSPKTLLFNPNVKFVDIHIHTYLYCCQSSSSAYTVAYLAPPYCIVQDPLCFVLGTILPSKLGCRCNHVFCPGRQNSLISLYNYRFLSSPKPEGTILGGNWCGGLISRFLRIWNSISGESTRVRQKTTPG